MFRSCQTVIGELCSLLKLYYSIQNSIRICKRGVVAAYHVVWECVVEHCTAQHIPTQHDMLPQHLVCKYELNCEYCNINLAKSKAPWWWSDKIETCRSVLKRFMWNYMCIRWLINWSNSTKMHSATIRFISVFFALKLVLCSFRSVLALISV